MNCRVVLAAEGRPDQVGRGFQAARQFIAAAEARFTRFNEISELAALNRSGGAWFQASPELFEVMLLAQQLFRETGGLFDPAILPALENAGYDKCLDAIKLDGVSPVRSGQPGRSDFGAIRLDADRRGIYLPIGTRIDLGGIAKGWIAEQAARVLARFSPVCAVNAGGDQFAVGVPPEGAWPVALEDPYDASTALAVLYLPAGALATSAVTRRRWQQAGRERHHLIDPRTGEPAETDWRSVTVIAPHAAQAEAYAKALLLAGRRDAAWLSDRRDDVTYFAVDAERRLWGSARAREYWHVEFTYN